MPANDSKLISLMFMIGRRMREEMKQNIEKNGCSWLHFEALRYIEDNGKPTMRGVAEHFSVTPSAATLLVDGLVDHKLLRRIVDAKDRRTVRLALTLKGKKCLERGVEQRITKIKQLFSVLNEKEHAELIRILQKIA